WKVAYFASSGRIQATFQALPRLTGTFRYSVLRDCNCFGFQNYYDRSVDVQYQLLTGSGLWPAVAVGIRDIGGTGIYGAEYIVATSRLPGGLRVSGGLGFGRLGSFGGFANPFGLNRRPRWRGGTGGQLGADRWFRGPAALFGGIEWRSPGGRWTLKAEYSSDAYDYESGNRGFFARRSPINLGAEYRVGRFLRVGAYWMYGDALLLRGDVIFNPKERPAGGSIEPAPQPVFHRPTGRQPGAELRDDLSWVEVAGAKERSMAALAQLLERDGLRLEAFRTDGRRAEVVVRNRRYDSLPQAVGRTARDMSRLMPVSVEIFQITLLDLEGLPVLEVEVPRSALEALSDDVDAPEKMWQAVRVRGPRFDRTGFMERDLYPMLHWRIGPYTDTSLFDPANPARIDVGVRLSGEYELAPGVVLRGSVKRKLFGNLDQTARRSNSVLPHVRSDFALYNKGGQNGAIDYLTADYYFKAGSDLYGRLTGGLLERMFAGVAGELLWQRPDSPLALGLELALVQQRAFDAPFGLQDYRVATGHASLYYELSPWYRVQLDAGRYLAGDWGGTLTVTRRFDNGWEVGAFVTLTNVSPQQFGEGSFDKGIVFWIPASWAVAQPVPKVGHGVLRPITRDGGARLDLQGRLYDRLHRQAGTRLEAAWGRFWR
ncbi:MAG: YjbH domain-containing protein, partial [Alphaproteobacteria bacterium]